MSLWRNNPLPSPVGCLRRSGRTVLDSGAVARIPRGQDRIQRLQLVVARGPIHADVVARAGADRTRSRPERDADAAIAGGHRAGRAVTAPAPEAHVGW